MNLTSGKPEIIKEELITAKQYQHVPWSVAN